ncbi:hypothetical protein QVD17_30866 [Tagetes erecta]|uniref:Uncharacterized protein n=1 Tax=Tagetes erecta TaxID=13708 RepID=A0AAD8NGC7_TARER|nr:hypothetical protein QVD17_30866 [Tagetes erecta]
MHTSQTVGDLVRNVLHKGQSIAELVDSMIVPANTKEVKIVGWKYDEVFDVFLIKRVNALCDVYHFYTSILQLLVQDLQELVKLPLRNPSRSERAEGLVNLLNIGVNRSKGYLETRCSQEDSRYFDHKKRKKEAGGEVYLHELCDKKLRENHRTRNLEDMFEDAIEIFGTFELKLLHSSYIYFMLMYKMEKVVNEVSEIDRKHFVAIIEAIAAAMERISFRKALE